MHRNTILSQYINTFLSKEATGHCSFTDGVIIIGMLIFILVVIDVVFHCYRRGQCVCVCARSCVREHERENG